jgi:hypothetical protein
MNEHRLHRLDLHGRRAAVPELTVRQRTIEDRRGVAPPTAPDADGRVGIGPRVRDRGTRTRSCCLATAADRRTEAVELDRTPARWACCGHEQLVAVGPSGRSTSASRAVRASCGVGVATGCPLRERSRRPAQHVRDRDLVERDDRSVVACDALAAARARRAGRHSTGRVGPRRARLLHLPVTVRSIPSGWWRATWSTPSSSSAGPTGPELRRSADDDDRLDAAVREQPERDAGPLQQPSVGVDVRETSRPAAR